MTDKTYTISELAKEFGVTTRTIRFYEEKGLISPRREGQKRLYTTADRVRIKLILRGKRIGMTLQECVDFIDMYDPEHNNAEQLHSLIRRCKRPPRATAATETGYRRHAGGPATKSRPCARQSLAQAALTTPTPA